MPELTDPSSLIHQLLNLSHAFGNDAAHVQGGGGNTSIKDEKDELLIKASGTFLSEMTTEKGFLPLRYKPFINLLADEKSTQEDYDSLLKRMGVQDGEGEVRPSMESGFHAVLGKVVLHTHSVLANLVNCSISAENHIRRIFAKEENVHLMPYLNPGFELSKALYIASKQSASGLNTYFLKNHGIIVEGKNMAEVLAEYRRIHDLLEKEFKPKHRIDWRKPEALSGFYKSESAILLKYLNNYEGEIFSPTLFPDQSVYTDGQVSFESSGTEKIKILKGEAQYHCSEREAIAIDQTLTAYAFIYLNLKARQEPFLEIPKADSRFILNLQSEKFRKNQL